MGPASLAGRFRERSLVSNPCPPPLAIHVREEPQRVLAEVSGELDLATVDGLSRSLDELRRAGRRDVTVDLARVSFMDATGLRTLLEARRRYEESGAVLSFAGESRAVTRLLEICGAVLEARRTDEAYGNGTRSCASVRIGPIHWSGRG